MELKKILRAATIKKYRLHNLLAFFVDNSSFILPNGYELEFNSKNKKDVEKLFEFSLINGVIFFDSDGFWRYKGNTIILPNGIKLYINKFHPTIFKETFLYDIHFTDFNLEGKVVIQAGGFTGDTALYYSYRGAKVFSFEPDPNNFFQAIRNIKLNPDLSNNIVMKNYAIGSDGEILFPLDQEGNGGSSVYEIQNRKTIKVKSVTIDTILSEFNIGNPYLLDLDIKGNEFKIINDKSISKFQIVRIEYSTLIDKKKIGDRKDIITKLEEYGFNKFRIFKHNDINFDLSEHGTIEAIRT